MSGTLGGAIRKRVRICCRASASKVEVDISSAKYNVPPSGLKVVFRQFRGISSFTRNTKLKLSVYGSVIRGVGKIVAMSSAVKIKDAFAIRLPYQAEPS